MTQGWRPETSWGLTVIAEQLAPVAGKVAAREALLEAAELAKKWKPQELRAWRQVALHRLQLYASKGFLSLRS